MAGLRRALLWASASKYVLTVVNLLTTAVVARLLTPEEFGVSVLGMAVFGMAEALRELGGGNYLIQRKELGPDQIRSTVTISFVVTLFITTGVVLLAGPLARFYGRPELTNYLLLIAPWFAMGPFVYPVLALMSRDMEFGKVALITVVTSLTNSALVIILAIEGFSYMSFAWATVGSGVIGMLIGLYLWSDLSIFRPLLSKWRDVLAFSVYDSATSILLRLWENVPYFILAKFLTMGAVGLYQRTFSVCQFPDRVIMAGVGAVALPAFSQQSRRGEDLKVGYISAVSHITGLQWPALIVLAVLAHPVVVVLLGSQWLETVPLIRILCVALLFNFPTGLNYPVLVAAGAIRFVPLLVLVQGLVLVGILTLAAQYGLEATIVSMLVIMPISVFSSLLFVRRQIHFTWLELALATRKSVAITFLSAVGPVAVVIASGGHGDMSIKAAAIAAILAGFGWIGGVWLTGHPLWDELQRARLKFAERYAINWPLTFGKKIRPNAN
jgi:O-antigen/teichoic acid export membrane protein